MISSVSAIDKITGRSFATVPQVWAARVQLSPEAPFLIWNGNVYSFSEAWSVIEGLAKVLTEELGIQRGHRVCGFVANSPDALWAWFGALRADASYVALNRAFKGLLLEARIRASRAQLIISDEAGWAEIGKLDFTALPAVAVIDHGRLQILKSPSDSVGLHSLPALEALRNDPFAEAGVIGTSGSTGQPKAVRLTHVALTHGAARVTEAWAITAADTIHAWLPHFHIAGQLNQSLPAVIAGCRLALFPTFSASRFWQEIRDVGATIVIGLPNVVKIVWQQPDHPPVDRATLRLWVTGAMDQSIHRAFEERFGVQVLEQYGMTEAELITLPRFGEFFPLGSCGRPGPDWELQIADENDRPVPSHTVGQILIRPRVAGILMLGYDGDDAATAAALRNAWFHCGDLGYLDDDQYLFFVERRKYVIRRRGENIASAEIEKVVSLHPAVAECAAIGVPSELGEEDVKLVVQPRPGQSLGREGLREFCLENLPRFMVPRFIEIVAELPHSAVGKVDKELLRQLVVDAGGITAR